MLAAMASLAEEEYADLGANDVEEEEEEEEEELSDEQLAMRLHEEEMRANSERMLAMAGIRRELSFYYYWYD
jgi:hypothetical protein